MGSATRPEYWPAAVYTGMTTRETVNQAVQQLFSMSVVAREEQGVHKDNTNDFEGYSCARRRREDSRYYRTRHVGLALNDIYGPNFDVDSFDTDSYHHPRYNGRPNFYRSQRYFDGYNRNTKDYRPRWLYPKPKARPWVRLNSDDRKRDNSGDRVKEVHKECIKSESVSKDTSVPNEEVQERPSSANSLGNNDVNIEGAITIKTEDISDTETECCFGEEYQFPEEINDITIECIDTNKSYLKPAEELTSMILENKRTPDVPSTACPCFDHVLQPSVRTSRPRRRHSVGGEQARKILHSRCKRSKSVGPAPSAGPLTRSKSVSRNLWGPLPLPSRMKRKQPENEGTEERASEKPEGKEERASDKPEGSGSAMMKYGEFKKLHTEKPDSHDLMQKLFGDSEDIEEQNIEQYKKLWNPQMFIQGRRKSKEGERKRKSTDERDEAQIKPKKVCKDEGSNKPNNEPLKVCHASNSTCMDIPFTPLAAISPFCPVKQKALITKYILRKATVILPVKGEAEVINVVQESEKTVTIDLTNEENADHVYDAICKELESLRSMPSFSLSDDKKEILVTSGSGLSTTIVRKKIGSSKGASMPDISSLDKEVSQKNLNAQEEKSSQLSDAQKPPTTSERNSSPELKKISSKHCRQIAANKLQSTEKKDLQISNKATNNNFNKKEVKPQKSEAKTAASGDVPDSDVAQSKKVPSITDSTVEITSRLETDHEHSLTMDAQNNSLNKNSNKKGVKPQKSKAKTPASGDVPDSDVAHPKKVPSITDSTVEITSRLEKDHEHSLTTDAQNNSVSLSSIKENLDPFLVFSNTATQQKSNVSTFNRESKIQEQPLQDSVKAMKNMEQDKNKSLTQTTVQLATAVLQQNGQDTCATVVKSNNPMSSSVTEQQKGLPADIPRINVPDQPIPESSSSLTVGMVLSQAVQDAITNAKQQKILLLDTQTMDVSGQPIPQTSSSVTAGMVPKQSGQDKASSSNIRNAEEQKNSPSDTQRTNMSGQSIPQTSSSVTVGIVSKQYGQDRASSSNVRNAEEQRNLLLDTQRMNISGQSIPQSSSSVIVEMVPKQSGQDRDSSSNIRNAEEQRISPLDTPRMNVSDQPDLQSSSSVTVEVVPKQSRQDRVSSNTTNAEQQKISTLDAQRINISGQPIPQTSSSLTVGMVPKQYGQDSASRNTTNAEQQKTSLLDAQRMNVSGQPIPQTSSSLTVGMVSKQYGQDRTSTNTTNAEQQKISTLDAQRMNISGQPIPQTLTSVAVNIQRNSPNQVAGNRNSPITSNASTSSIPFSHGNFVPTSMAFGLLTNQSEQQKALPLDIERINASYYASKMSPNGRIEQHNNLQSEMIQVTTQPDVAFTPDKIAVRKPRVYKRRRSSKTLAMNMQKEQVANQPKVPQVINSMMMQLTSVADVQRSMAPNDNRTQVIYQNNPRIQVRQNLTDPVIENDTSTNNRQVHMIPSNVPPTNVQNLMISASKIPPPNVEIIKHLARSKDTIASQMLQHLSTVSSSAGVIPQMVNPSYAQSLSRYGVAQVPVPYQQQHHSDNACNCQRCCSHNNNRQLPPQHQTMPAALQAEPSAHQRVTSQHQTMLAAHQIPPSAHQRVPPHQTMTEAHQRVPQQHQTMPAALQTEPSVHQRVTPRHQTMPAAHQIQPSAHQRVLPQHQTMPEAHQRVFPQHQTIPEAHQRMPPQQQTMPEVHQRLPQQHQTMLEAHQRMLLQHQTMPEAHQRMPPQQQTMPEVHQRMPPQQQTMPEVHQRLPQQHQTMLEAHQRMPLQHQTMPLAHQTLPSSNQALNSRQVSNMQQPHHLSNAGLQKWQDHQKSYVNANSTWTPPLMQTSLAANQMDTNKQAVQSAQNQFVDTSQNLQYPAQSQANNVPITLETLLQEQNKVAPIPPSRQWISQQHQLEAQSLPNNQNTIDKLVGNRQELRPLYLEELLRETHYGIASIAVENNIRAVVFNGYKNHFPSEYVADQMGYYHRSFLFKLMNLADAASKSISDTFLADFNLRQYMSDLEITLKIKYKLVLTTQRLMVAAKTLFVAMSQTNRNNSWLVKVIDEMIKLEPWLDQQKPQTTEQEPNVSEEQQRINAAPSTAQSPASNRPPSQQSQHTAPPPTYEESQRVAPTQLPIIQLGPRPPSNFGVMVKPADSPHFENGYQVSSSPASTTSTGYASMGPDNSLTSPLCSPDIVRPQTAHDPEHQDVVVSYNQLDHMRLVDTDEDDDEKLEIKNHFSAEVTVDCVDLTGSPEVRVKDECVDLTENWFDEGRMKMWHEQVHAQIEPIEYEVEIKPEVMNNDVATTSAVEMYHAGFIGKMCTCGKPAVEICSCRKAMYCSEHCRILDWCNHKKQCQSDTIL